MIENIVLKLDWPQWLFFLITLILLGLSFLYYFRTLPPLSQSRRVVSTFLRAAGLIIIFFLLLRPVLQIISRQHEKPVVAFLLDNSASMKVSESYGPRGDSLQYVYKELAALNPGDSLELALFLFDLSLKSQSGEGLTFKTDGTDISGAITSVVDSLSGKNLQGIVLLSDGIYNRGANPLLISQNINVPIYTVMIGDTTLPKDIAIRRIQTNPVTYLNKELPIDVVIWQNGFDGQKVILSVYQGKKQIARQPVKLVKSGFEQKEHLTVIPREEGDFTYTVQVQKLPEEITDRNNYQNVGIKVLKSKVQVLVFSGAPNYDRHFLEYAAEQLKDYQFTFLTEKSPGRYYETDFERVKIDSVDLIVFHGFPTPNTNVQQLEKVFRQVNKRKIPLMWFLNRLTAVPQLQNYKSLIPFALSTQLNPLENISAQLTTGGDLHPVTRLEESETANQLLWSELPPLEVYDPVKYKPGSQILMETAGYRKARTGKTKKYPVLYVYREKEIKHMVFCGSNFGFWHFQLQEDPLRDQLFIRFVERSVRWLVNRDDINPIQIRPVQQSFNLGDQVVFSGQVYNEFYNPITDVQVKITITGDNSEYSDEMNMEAGGYYRSVFAGLPEGKFHYTITAEKDGRQIGVRRGKFTVNPFYLEFQQIAGNAAMMRQMAKNTGGQFFLPGQFVRHFRKLDFRSRTQFSFSEYFLWSYIHWLFVIVLLLSIEWFLRKRWGLL